MDEEDPKPGSSVRDRSSLRGRISNRRNELQGWNSKWRNEVRSHSTIRFDPNDVMTRSPSQARNTDRFHRQQQRDTENRGGFQRNYRREHWSAHHKGYCLPRRSYPIAFKTLEEISQSSVNDIIPNINRKKEPLFQLLQAPIEMRDVYVIILEIFSKVCESPFVELKYKLILDVCNSNFINSLLSYLMELPYVVTKSSNNLYWSNQIKFWKNFITFCECIVAASPSTALKKCRSIIDNASKACIDGLSQRHGFVLPEEYILRLNQLKDKLTTIENEPLDKRVKRLSEDQPPDNFRELSVVPTWEDLMQIKPFLRPNIIDGRYKDVEHYLDVQFRLLREDCFGPFRDGINQYIADPHKRKYDHIRVSYNVKFIKPYISQTKIGSLIKIDTTVNKNFKRINWTQNKRFLFGSMVLFTKDNCKTFMVGTILDRDVNSLSEGKITVSIIDKGFDGMIYNDDLYTMIESEVYFEPYLHALKVLQDPSFPEDLAMQKYIVNVDPVPKHPAYLTNDKQFIIKDTGLTIEEESRQQRSPSYSPISEEIFKSEEEMIEPMTTLLKKVHRRSTEDNYPELKFLVLQKETWPTKDELNFDDSQYEAYQLALTHEFAVIQGPPGTGKTYLGINVAKTLLRNIEPETNCLMLVICFTNHALDQFLEAILKITSSIVRIGGQSRNQAMENINLNKLRRELCGCSSQSVFNDQKYALRDAIGDFRRALICLDVLNNGVISYHCIKDDVREITALGEYYSTRYDISKKDPLQLWLFSQSFEYVSDFKNCLLEYENYETLDDNAKGDKKVKENDDYLLRLRTEMIMDEIELSEENYDVSNNQLTASFSVDDAKLKLKTLVLKYKTSQDYSEKYFLKEEILHMNSKVNLYNDMSTRRNRQVRLHITGRTNFDNITLENRWSLYYTWVKNTVDNLKAELDKQQTLVTTRLTAYEEARMMVDAQLLKGTKVVGMTTSGAARMRKLLQTISPTIVIVEEAAEVLEQHIITSLTKSCQHLILIGDHQQLRPSASHMKLAKKYNLEVSLFERMITNGIHSRRLNVQHRMRPEIAQLISPHIYPDLQNHPTVEYFEDVRGMTTNVFFFSHNHQEEKINENTSRSNHKEADLVLGLANYIVQQGYSSEDVTILAAYSGQMFYMKKERNAYAYLSGVKITVVDNYQGEESKIILLSLVRNNDENKIGFLGTENRICVALSRAKEGFYMFGNMDMLKQNSPLWLKISWTLETNNALGKSIKLKCQNHPDQITEICSTADFSKVPEGGCLSKCNFSYKCGHLCRLFCHGYDREHITTKCTMACERVLCDLQHVCPLKCREVCEPCKVPVLKTLPCGHEMNVYCYREPEDPANKCLVTIDVTLPDCGHAAQKACYKNIKNVKCAESCVFRLDNCGHVCCRKCHVTDDPNHEKYRCGKACARAKKGCQANLIGDRGDHQCQKKCYEDCDSCNVQVPKKRSNCKHIERISCCENIDNIPCKRKCARTKPCGHFCKNNCDEPCGECNQMVMKPIPECGHKIKIECSKEPTRNLCTAKCESMLSCGHPCTDICGVSCDVTKCNEVTTQEVESPCGHKVKLPCHISKSYAKGEVKPSMLLAYCKAPCGVELECKHLCCGTCSTCYQGRLHVPCKQKCNQDNICGHQCEEPCNQLCPPCKKLCEVKCPHSHCKKMCGQPCTPCMENCDRRCIHGACTRRCGEPCDRAPCDARCRRLQPCGHACRGLCGEPCPSVCRVCRPDTFPRDFLGDDYGDTEIFILLQDCGHVLELDDMENLMKGDQESIQIRKCPFCRTPIINTNRYKDLVNGMFKNDINPIKERIYGTKPQIMKKREEIRTKYISCRRLINSTTLNKFEELKRTFNKFVGVLSLIGNMSLLHLEMILLYLNIFEIITKCCQEYVESDKTDLYDKFKLQIDMFCRLLVPNKQTNVKNVKKQQNAIIYSIKLSQQQQKDINNEIKRMNAIVQFEKLFVCAELRKEPGVSECLKKTEDIVFSLRTFDEDEAIKAVKSLQNIINASVVVSKLERELIVKAIGLKAGRWFKCPNGHFYAIGECGGATQVSKCADCGVDIGGTNHRLLPTNAHAPEMDDSTYPAWSEQNNLANFDI